MVMVPLHLLCPCLLSTLEAAEDVQVAGLLWCMRQCKTASSSFEIIPHIATCKNMTRMILSFSLCVFEWGKISAVF